MANRAQETTSGGANKQRGGRPGGSPQGVSDTGLPAKDPTYGLVSVLYHALQGAETYQKYGQDAQKAGDPELQQFFDNCRREEHARALQAKSLLAERLEEEEDDEEGESDDDSDEEEE